MTIQQRHQFKYSELISRYTLLIHYSDRSKFGPAVLEDGPLIPGHLSQSKSQIRSTRDFHLILLVVFTIRFWMKPLYIQLWFRIKLNMGSVLRLSTLLDLTESCPWLTPAVPHYNIGKCCGNRQLINSKQNQGLVPRTKTVSSFNMQVLHCFQCTQNACPFCNQHTV